MPDESMVVRSEKIPAGSEVARQMIDPQLEATTWYRPPPLEYLGDISGLTLFPMRYDTGNSGDSRFRDSDE